MFRIETGTPAAAGYQMPAEWAPHAATWLTWPRPEGISFPGRYDGIVPPIWARLTALLAEDEEVHINVFSAGHRAAVEEALRAARVPFGEGTRVRLHDFPAYEPWCRDHGPIFVTKEGGERAIVDWGYNAWGGKYPPCDLDDHVPVEVAKFRGLPLYQPGIVMEGGSLDVNGAGTLLTTESCLLNPNRNPHLTRADIEKYLADYLGIQKVLWLGDGILGDDTDGHVDDLTRFVSVDTVVTVVEDDPNDENYAPLRENRERLATMTTACGLPLRVVDLPMPKPLHCEGQRLPASYANFYIANGKVLVPVFNDPADAKACAILQELFPDRRVIPFDASDLIWGLGALHCITQQEPSGAVAKK
ncbi:agmatine deiminase [Verrucomicrobium sp. GAS474]|uniref:agmatine deiminase family protein n=1 Tax=Verrucomicrobium sp. GAS474 TaxID=1882831 RepID=UPI00087D1D4D|nr:agmatine deiminase family protein [Verrucomicrobium sp. GAS474]SDU10278.1 agmatine deiminase [Verrucomicrobium sp. GAS474]